MPFRSALVVPVPEVEWLVRPFRERLDPSAAAGMPAHVTLLFPFAEPAEIDAVLLDELADMFACFKPFRFRLVQVQRFPEVIYLHPEPDEPFRALTTAIWNRYPDLPPYGGQHAEIVPHLTVAHVADNAEGDAVAGQLDRAMRRVAPVALQADEISLVENSSGRWQRRAGFPLGPAPGPSTDNIHLAKT